MKLVIDIRNAETGEILAMWIDGLIHGEVEWRDRSKRIPKVNLGMIGCVVLCDGWHEEGEHLIEVVHDVWRSYEPGKVLTPEQQKKLEQITKKWLKEIEQ